MEKLTDRETKSGTEKRASSHALKGDAEKGATIQLQDNRARSILQQKQAEETIIQKKENTDVVQRMPGDYERIKAQAGNTVTIEYKSHDAWTPLRGAVTNVKNTSIYIGGKRFTKNWLDDFDFRITDPAQGPELLDTHFAMSEYTVRLGPHKDGWTALSLPNKIKLLQDTIAQKFLSNGIPPPTVHLFGAEHRNGEFDSTTWSFSISQAALEKGLATPAATAYHESRHAEQFFLMARYIVQNQLQPPHSKQIPDKVFIAAVQANKTAPLAGAQLEKAENFYHSIFGKGAEHRQTTLKMLSVYTSASVKQKGEEYTKNREDYEAKYKICEDYAKLHKQNTLAAGKPWPDETQAANMAPMRLAREVMENSRLRFLMEGENREKASAAYYELPEEKEAHALGDRVREDLEKF
jgi:hypothetical protein